jgi:hypothetical protein
MAAPDPVDPAVAARIVEWLTAWHRDADPGEDTPHVTVTILDSAGEPAGQAVLTRRQADELAAWQAGVASNTSAPWARAAELRRRTEQATTTPSATVVFAEPYGGDAYPVPLGAADADRFATTIEMGIRQRALVRSVIREQSPYRRGQRVRVREDAGGAAAGQTGTVGWITVFLPDDAHPETTFWYDVHLDLGDDEDTPAQTFTADQLAPVDTTPTHPA